MNKYYNLVPHKMDLAQMNLVNYMMPNILPGPIQMMQLSPHDYELMNLAALEQSWDTEICEEFCEQTG